MLAEDVLAQRHAPSPLFVVLPRSKDDSEANGGAQATQRPVLTSM